MKKIFLLLSLFCLSFAGKAQTAASYAFSEFSDPYASILTDPGTFVITSLWADDATEVAVPIGFTFKYCGVNYTSLSICTNGWVSLTNSPTTAFDNLETNIDGRGWLMPFWDDLDLSFSGDVLINVSGTAPSRVFTVEWLAAPHIFSTGEINFQLKLYEGTDIIDFHYGSDAFLLFGVDATIGISDDAVSDWQTLNEEFPTALPVFAPLFINDIFSAPFEDQVFRWTPPLCLIAGIAGTLTTCPGLPTVLTNPTLGGTWSSSTPVVATVGAATGIVTGVSSGTATITYSTSPTCFTTAVVTVTAVTPIVGSLSVCVGSTSTLTNVTGGGAWTSSSAAVATVGLATGIVAGIAPGTSIITYTMPSGCIATAVVTVSATTPITGTLSVCRGLTTTLGNPTAGGTWSSSAPGTASVDAATGEVFGVSLGTATITYTLPGGCTATAVVTVNPAPFAISGVTSICQGGTTIFTCPTAGGTWSSSISTVASIDPSTGIATTPTGGITTISYTLPTGCFSTLSLTVNPLPATITGATMVCVGNTTALSSTTTGGTWNSTVAAIASVDASSGLVTGVFVGSAVISYTLASGCARAVTVTVTPAVAPITGSATVCRTQSTTLTSATTGGTWSSSAPAIASVDAATGVVTGIALGTATISYTVSSSCFATVVVTVNPFEPITGAASVCIGGSTTFSNAIAGGTWSSSDVAVATVVTGTGVVTGITTGTSEISYTNTSGCISTLVVTVITAPATISGDLLICVGNTSTLSTTASGGTWSQSSPGVITIDAVTGVVTALAVGTGTVTYSLSSGCEVTAVVTVNPAPAAITGIAPLCPGTFAAVAHPVGGGTWSVSDATIATVNAVTGLVTGVALSGGTTTVTYTLPSSACFVTTVVTVSPAPAAFTGSLSLCIGGTTTLSTTTPGVSWASSNVAVATVGAATGIVSGISAGTSTITCTAPNSCIRTAIVTVNPNPGAITGTATVCAGSTTTLSATPAGGVWSSSNVAIATVAAGVVTGVAAGTATISYSIGTCFSIRVVTVNPLPAMLAGTASACVGLTATLTSGPAGGTWTSSNSAVATVVAATGVVTGVSVGTANITYTLNTGCFRTRTFVVNPLPSAISGSTVVCPASTVTLTSASTGGTWASSTPAVATVATGTGVVTGVAGGTTTITYTLGTGCFTTTVVTVIAAPVAALTPIGDTILCPGDFVTLTSSAAVGATYQWFNGGVLIPGITAPTYTTSTPGSYQVRVSIAAGCSTLSAPMTVTVVPATATITVPGGTTSACAGLPIVLNANTGTGLTYQWEQAGVPIAGATTSTLSATVSGSYAVRVTNAAGCWALSAPVAVTITPAPSSVVSVSGPLNVCAGGSVTITATAAPGNTYQWFDAAGPITGATGVAYTATASGDYYVQVTNTAGCSAVSALTIFNVNPLPDATITAAGPTVFCLTDAVLLSAVPGLSYQWLRNGTAIIGANTANYPANASGSYRVVVFDAVTGCTDTTLTPIVVTVIAAPTTITLTPARFCWGGSSLLSTTVSGLGSALTYQWFFNGASISGATSPTYSAGTEGDYYCQISVPGSCTLPTNVVSVSQVPLPNPLVAFSGTAVYTSNMYVTYQWYKDLIAIPGATAASTPVTGNGNYKVAVTDTNGCQAVSATYVLTGWTGTNSVTDINQTDVSIYPNPAAASVYITAQVSVTAIISSIDGKALITQPNAKEVSLSGLADGVYIITLFDANGQQLKVQKLIKKQ